MHSKFQKIDFRQFPNSKIQSVIADVHIDVCNCTLNFQNEYRVQLQMSIKTSVNALHILEINFRQLLNWKIWSAIADVYMDVCYCTPNFQNEFRVQLQTSIQTSVNALQILENKLQINFQILKARVQMQMSKQTSAIAH